ncbi:Zinc finger C2H2-type [Babesia duncani]|uniref:Zinc finger C2H2-type n=1 Tax=Babesia duncani TaxID=323732 RepID=A0AAD9PLG8_9APIC|nr:Zinc finger C2H2-type [Babesia duncani]
MHNNSLEKNYKIAMKYEGIPPLSSALYYTKRRLLSASYKLRNTEVGLGDFRNGSGFFNTDDASHSDGHHLHSSSRHVPSLQEYLFRLSLSYRNIKTPSTDDDLTNGLIFLSQHPSLNFITESNFKSGYKAKSRTSTTGLIYGRIEQLDEILKTNRSNYNFQPLEPLADGKKRCPDGKNVIVGPMSANEVALLIACALKLKETDCLDRNLESKLDRSTRTWRHNGRVPNIVYPSLIAELFENRLVQCNVCGLRFTSADSRQLHVSAIHESGRRSSSLWNSLDGWIASSIHNVKSTARSLTLETLRRLLVDAGEYGSIAWLRYSLEIPVQATSVEDVLESQNTPKASARQRESDSMLLWNWATLNDCNEGDDFGVSHQTPNIEIISDFSPGVIQQMFERTSENVQILNARVPGGICVEALNICRAKCGLCFDDLCLRYSVHNNAPIYYNTCGVCIDWDFVSQAFPIAIDPDFIFKLEHGPIDPFLSLSKIACLRLYYSGFKSRASQAVTTHFEIARSKRSIDSYTSAFPPDFADMAYVHVTCIGAILRHHIGRAKQGNHFSASLASLYPDFGPI